MTKDLFDVTPERVAEIMRQHGFIPSTERPAAEIETRKAEVLNRTASLPYTDASPDLKAQRIANLKRRLAHSGDHYTG